MSATHGQIRVFEKAEFLFLAIRSASNLRIRLVPSYQSRHSLIGRWIYLDGELCHPFYRPALEMPDTRYTPIMTDIRMILYVSLTLLVLALFRRQRSQDARRKTQHLPSPRSLPFIGNLLSIPAGVEHKAYMELGRQLNSDIVSLKLLGQKILILNSAQAATDMLEKRSALYSDRSSPPMIEDPTLLDWSTLPTLLRYNDLWRHHRRMMNNWLNARAVTQFRGIQEQQARLLLKRLLDLPDDTKPFDSVREALFL